MRSLEDTAPHERVITQVVELHVRTGVHQPCSSKYHIIENLDIPGWRMKILVSPTITTLCKLILNQTIDVFPKITIFSSSYLVLCGFKTQSLHCAGVKQQFLTFSVAFSEQHNSDTTCNTNMTRCIRKYQISLQFSGISRKLLFQ